MCFGFLAQRHRYLGFRFAWLCRSLPIFQAGRCSPECSRGRQLKKPNQVDRSPGAIGTAIGASVPSVEKAAPSRSLRAGAIGAAVGASVLAIGAERIMPGTLSGFFHSAAASSAEVSSKIDRASTGTQTTVPSVLPAVPYASSFSIDVSLLVGLVMAVLVGRSHLISAAGKLRDRLKNSTRSPNGLAILALLALAVVAASGSRTLNARYTGRFQGCR